MLSSKFRKTNTMYNGYYVLIRVGKYSGNTNEQKNMPA